MAYQEEKTKLLNKLALQSALVFSSYLEGVKSEEFRGVVTDIKEIYCTLKKEEKHLRDDNVHLLPCTFRMQLR